MGKINATWHKAHKMPKNPTLQQRLVWHEEHAKHCECRALTEKLRMQIEEMKRGRLEVK